MSTTHVYDKIISSMPSGIERTIFVVLRFHVGKGSAIRIEEIARQALGKANDTTVRQAREAIEVLRKEYHVPIVSESGQAGRWIAADQSELDGCIAEFAARRRNIDDVIDALRQAKLPPPDHLQKPAQLQPGLL